MVAAVGLVIGLRRRSQAALLAGGWLLLVLDFSTFGILERLFPALIHPIARYDYPFSIAWHGPIIPYALLGGLALAWAWERLSPHINERRARGAAYAGLGVVAAGIVLGGVFSTQILALSKGRITFYGAFSSEADVRAMTWLRENTDADAYILNFPGPQEGDWVPVIAERKSVYYRPQPFFQRGADPLADTAEQQALRAFWADPADADNAALLERYGVDYVIVPQVVGNPVSFAAQYRWQPPFAYELDMQSTVSDAPYLSLVYEADGARVFRVE